MSLNWQETDDKEYELDLKFEFVRVQIWFYFLKWRITGLSVFIEEPLQKISKIMTTTWNMPFKSKAIEVKYHYSCDEFDELVSFSPPIEDGDKGFNETVQKLDGKTIKCKMDIKNKQKLKDFEGEIYPIPSSVEVIE